MGRIFIDVFDGGLSSTITIGNIYRPPTNLNSNFRTFFDELILILSKLSRSKHECFLTDDYSLNLLEVNENTNVAEFFDIINSYSFYPTIAFPTRFSERNGIHIDDFFY